MKVAVLKLPVTEMRVKAPAGPFEYPDELVPESPSTECVSVYTEETAVKDHKE